jgi:Sulfotransferase domain
MSRARDALNRRLRRTLPRPAYNHLQLNYQRLCKLSRRNPGRGRVLPEFVIIGAAKAGTTSLYAWLSEHPFVASSSQKEVHFFDYNYYRGEDWYRRHFPLEAERAAFASRHGRPFLTGEASPSYLSHHWAPRRLARLLPRARLIVSLRNPVDRAYSQFQMSRREGEEALDSFMEAVEAEERRLAPERARMQRSRHYNSWPIGCWSYLMRSRYAEQLEHWLTLVSREQLHVLTLEQMADDPQGALDGVHRFLGLPAHRYEDLRPLHTASYEPIGAEDRAMLNDYFRPHNERLYELLGVDFGWERTAIASGEESLV